MSPNRPIDPSSLRIQHPESRVPRTGKGGASHEGFREILGEEMRITKHAEERMGREGLQMDAAQTRRVKDAMTRLADRGAEQSLLLIDDLAMIVNVRNRTLVTVVSGERRGDGVFTDIDSAVIAD